MAGNVKTFANLASGRNPHRRYCIPGASNNVRMVLYFKELGRSSSGSVHFSRPRGTNL